MPSQPWRRVRRRGAVKTTQEGRKTIQEVAGRPLRLNRSGVVWWRLSPHDVFSGMVIGWQVSTGLGTNLALEALDLAWACG